MSIKNVLPLLFALLSFGCNNANNETNKTEDTVIKEIHEQASHHDEEHADALALNKGAKWQTDESTREHAAKLIAETNAFNTKGNAEVSGYHAFASDMQKGLNSLISDCKMKGKNHEALHLWLEPVLKDVSDLKKINVADEGKHATEKLTNDINKFNQYFN
ncbi:MAG: hypothetical protein WKF35_08590 [Ferruginibacter sp.]